MRFDVLRESLLQGGVAPRHVRRYLAELEDHLADLTVREIDSGHALDDAAICARAALGDDAMLAQAMLAQPKLRSLVARAPWAVFILAPPFAMILAFLIPTLALVIIGKTHGMMMHNTIAAPQWFQHLAAILALASNLLLPTLLSALFVRIATEQRLASAWPLIGMAVIALFGMHMQARFPSPGHRGGFINVGLLVLAVWRNWQAWAQQWPLLVAQIFLTLLPAAWLLRLPRRRAEI